MLHERTNKIIGEGTIRKDIRNNKKTQKISLDITKIERKVKMYNILPHFTPTNVIQLFNMSIILNQYIAITGLLIHNKIKRNGWSAIAESFALQKKMC